MKHLCRNLPLNWGNAFGVETCCSQGVKIANTPGLSVSDRDLRNISNFCKQKVGVWCRKGVSWCAASRLLSQQIILGIAGVCYVIAYVGHEPWGQPTGSFSYSPSDPENNCTFSRSWLSRLLNGCNNSTPREWLWGWVICICRHVCSSGNAVSCVIHQVVSFSEGTAV